MLQEPYSPSLCVPLRIATDTLDNHIRVNAIIESVHDKQLWIGTENGILALDINDFTPEIIQPEFDNSCVLSFKSDCEGVIWVATSNSGSYYIDTTPGCFDHTNSLIPSLPKGIANMTTVYQDHNGTIWAASHNNHIINLHPGASHWENPHTLLGFSENDMPLLFSMAEDKKGNCYYGCYGTLIWRNAEDKIICLDKSNSPAITDNHIMRMKTDSHDNVWLGTMKGFGVITHKGDHIALSDDGDVMGICEKGDTIYIATLNHGIFSTGIDRPISVESALGNSRITDQNGFQPVILSIASSKKENIIYVGTEDEGLWTYDPARGEYILTNYVPQHNNLQVAFIEEDKYGSLWVATNKGLYRINIDNPEQRTLYTKADGLKNDYFVYNGFATDSLLFLPTINNIEVIAIDSTDNINGSTRPIKFGITSIFFNSHHFQELPKDVQTVISGDLLPQYSQSLTIPADINNFCIEFAAYDYKDSRRVSFMYKLDGYDKEWMQAPENHNSATYTNLAPGTYTFHICAGYGNGKIASEERVVSIRILPPWYLSWPMILIYIILVAGAIITAMYLVRRREREKSRLMLLEQEKNNLEEVNHTKLRFFTNVTHELLTPLTVISASISELRDGNVNKKELYRIADVNVSKLVRLLQQILEFRKVETDNIRLRVHYGDICRFAASSAEAVRPLTLRKSQKMAVIMPNKTTMGYFDPDKLDKIIYNLVSNASKYSDENGTITVNGRISSDGRSFILEISDTGHGIPKSKQADLFKRFYDGDYREHNTQGTGIGLSLTKDLALLCHGTITVDSELGKGTCFTVTLPIVAEEFADNEIVGSTTSNPEEPAKDISGTEEFNRNDDSRPEQLSNYKLLIIEDNEDLLKIMKEVLGHIYDIVTATDGITGLGKAFNDNPDLIITDVAMPGIDGLELIRRLRKDSRTSLRPIIVLTALRQDEDRTECYEAGADVYLPKPFVPATLKACIATQLKSHTDMTRDKNGQFVINMKQCDYKSADEQFLTLAAEVVRKNLDNIDFDVPSFARETGMSQSNLFRKLKEQTDMTPSHFIRIIRLRNACQILDEHPDIRVNELAYMVGFGDVRYFSKCFKTEFGVIPRDYKSRLSNQLNNNKQPNQIDNMHT